MSNSKKSMERTAEQHDYCCGSAEAHELACGTPATAETREMMPVQYIYSAETGEWIMVD